MRLGDLVEKALQKVGITEARVSAFLGPNCGCKKRKEKLNQLGAWAQRVFNGDANASEFPDQQEVESIPQVGGEEQNAQQKPV